MGLRDITGVFSRYFIVGFFLPVFFTLLLIDISVHEGALPRQYRQLHDENRLFAIGGAALFIGLLLLGLRHPIWKLFEGLNARRMTALGQLTKAYQEAGQKRWGLDVPKAWPLISSLLTPGEHDRDVDLETDARLFFNGCLGALGIAAYWLVDAVSRGRGRGGPLVRAEAGGRRLAPLGGVRACRPRRGARRACGSSAGKHSGGRAAGGVAQRSPWQSCASRSAYRGAVGSSSWRKNA